MPLLVAPIYLLGLLPSPHSPLRAGQIGAAHLPRAAADIADAAPRLLSLIEGTDRGVDGSEELRSEILARS